MAEIDDARWLLRLETLSTAINQLEEAVALDAAKVISELEKSGLVKRFEIAWELSWRTMADFSSFMKIRLLRGRRVLLRGRQPRLA